MTNDERFHRRQHELGACRCGVDPRPAPTLADVQHFAELLRAESAKHPPSDYLIVRIPNNSALNELPEPFRAIAARRSNPRAT